MSGMYDPLVERIIKIIFLTAGIAFLAGAAVTYLVMGVVS